MLAPSDKRQDDFHKCCGENIDPLCSRLVRFFLFFVCARVLARFLMPRQKAMAIAGYRAEMKKVEANLASDP
jgi:hypothetical protein